MMGKPAMYPIYIYIYTPHPTRSYDEKVGSGGWGEHIYIYIYMLTPPANTSELQESIGFGGVVPYIYICIYIYIYLYIHILHIFLIPKCSNMDIEKKTIQIFEHIDFWIYTNTQIHRYFR